MTKSRLQAGAVDEVVRGLRPTRAPDPRPALTRLLLSNSIVPSQGTADPGDPPLRVKFRIDPRVATRFAPSHTTPSLTCLIIRCGTCGPTAGWGRLSVRWDTRQHFLRAVRKVAGRVNSANRSVQTFRKTAQNIRG